VPTIQGVENEFASPGIPGTLDPGQFLDDIVNRLKFGEPYTLGRVIALRML
jgi:hypothetical protein